MDGSVVVRRRTVRVLARVVLAVGLASGGTVLASSGVVTAQDSGDACSYSPDVGYVPVYYDFHAACVAHDVCYDTAKATGAGSAGRKACDDQFRSAMKGWCNSYYAPWWASPARVACRGVADTYYTAVRTFGGLFF